MVPSSPSSSAIMNATIPTMTNAMSASAPARAIAVPLSTNMPAPIIAPNPTAVATGVLIIFFSWAIESYLISNILYKIAHKF